MAANAEAKWVKEAQSEWCVVSTVNTAKDGTGTLNTNIWCAFTGATEGSFLECLVFRPQGTNAASVARIFLNNNSSNATAANNTLIGEVALPAITNIETTTVTGFVWAWNKMIPATYRILVTVGTGVTAWSVSGHGGKY